MQSITQIISPYNNHIKKIDQIILEFSKGKSPLIHEISTHLIKSGGKRIRPILLLMAADLCCQEIDAAVLSLAASVEMIHSATLLHDDVVDNSLMRRNQQTANSIWDNKASILVGDYIFSIAFQLMVKSDSLKALDLLAKTSSIMADGEVMQLENSNNIDIEFETYIKIIYGKTAILFSSACCVPAIIASKSEEEFLALQEFGKNLGIIFQIIDDILDYTATQQNLGKKIGDDFFEGKVTLPLIKLYQQASTQERDIINKIHQDNLMSIKNDENLRKIMDLIAKYDILTQCKQVVKSYKDKAIDNLKIFDDNSEKQRLISMLNHSSSRVK